MCVCVCVYVLYLGLEAADESDDERVVGEGEDVALGEHLLHLVAQHQVVFEQLLERESFPRQFVPHQVHSAETTQTKASRTCLVKANVQS